MSHNNTLPRLHVVGDSISIHYGPYLAPLLADIVECSRKTGGVGLRDDEAANWGDSNRVVEYLRSLRRTGRLPIRYLMLNCGLHDIKRQLTKAGTGSTQVPNDVYAQNLEQMIILAREIDSQPIWIRTTPVVDTIHNHAGMEFYRYAADVEAYNSIADEIMRRKSVDSIDLFTFTRDLGPSAYCDHVHYGEGVRAQQAAFIAVHLRKIIMEG